MKDHDAHKHLPLSDDEHPGADAAALDRLRRDLRREDHLDRSDQDTVTYTLLMIIGCIIDATII